MARFNVGDGVLFPIFSPSLERGGPHVKTSLGVVIEVQELRGAYYNIRHLASGQVYGVIEKWLSPPDLLTQLAIASAEPGEL